MKKFFFLIAATCFAMMANAETQKVTSPDGKLVVTINLDNEGELTYQANYDGKEMLTKSALGLKTDMGDYTEHLKLVNAKEGKREGQYTMRGSKASVVNVNMNTVTMTFKAPKAKRDMVLEMCVGNNDIAYRYHFDGSNDGSKDEPRRVTIFEEESSFNFPAKTTTFICPQIDGNHQGWMSTKPSYEEEYKADAALTEKSKFGKGYTFPCLFRIGEDGWVLVSETGVGSNYCGCHLSDYDKEDGYTIAFPDKSENHGIGSTTPAFSLPGETPWRTITMGSTLKPIVETTIPFDVVEEQYKAHADMKPGRYVWSWLIWQDNSANYDDQVQFINTASEMGFEYCLVDALWDVQIGRERMAELSRYAQSKGVNLMLWYNSNGYANDAPQGPRNGMNTAIAREREMAWMESIGVKGIKVDFFGGDKQQTMQLYEDILSDANRHGIQVIFHGCTLPRGWEKMYPNYVASEAVLASENVYFSEYHAKQEGFQLTMHPFSRNVVGSMDWGGTIMNRWLNKEDQPGKRHRRYTSDTFEMAAGLMNQTTIQCIDVQPSNLKTLQQFELDFLKTIPTTWDKTMFIDGYPTKYAVLARKSTEGKWYVTGLNGEGQPRTLTLNVPMMAGKTVAYYTDEPLKKGQQFLNPIKKTAKVDAKGNVKVTMQGLGGIILTEE